MKTRLAVIDKNLCKPTKCDHECEKKCPVNKTKRKCIDIEDLASISESLCIGCGICVDVCPFKAIKIINLPNKLNTNYILHRYSLNSFALFKFPDLKIGSVLGLVGENGIGKSTILGILSGEIIPNFGCFDEKKSVLKYFKGTEMQKFLMETNKSFKPQDIKKMFENSTQTIHNIIQDLKINTDLHDVWKIFNLLDIKDRSVSCLSGGELQKLAIAVTCSKNCKIFLFDEPSSFLDIKQRILMANILKNKSKDSYVVVSEHDLTILDYLSDYVCCLYGIPGSYGIASNTYSSKDGINSFLNGYIQSENMKFRKNPLIFENNSYNHLYNLKCHSYEAMEKKIDNFSLKVESGCFYQSEILVIVGENGVGKTQFMKMLTKYKFANYTPIISYKPQHITFDNDKIKVVDLLNTFDKYYDENFVREVIKPLNITNILSRKIKSLSGGDMQILKIIVCLMKDADIYLMDEPSSFLDSERRLIVCKIIKKYIRNNNKTSFIIEHDFLMTMYLADKIIVFSGEPSFNTSASKPLDVQSGMNIFLDNMGVTFRRDENNRPRINKYNSINDLKQKHNKKYFD
uniref:ABC transporter domain-containing protein n=1 Tax=viral metagenome TaxID=1070528 RepID=A0A6C0J8A1_9ZZZZ